MSIGNRASIAHAVVSLASALDQEDPETIIAGVLARAPGDQATTLCQSIGEALGMAVAQAHLPGLEFHPGAINDIAYNRFEPAVATGRPVLVLLDEAHGADDGVIEALMRNLADRVEDQPCLVLAVTSAAGEKGVAERLATGLGHEPGRIASFRTADENARLVRLVAGA